MKKLLFILLAIAMAMVAGLSASLADRGYEGKQDLLSSSPYFDGVKSTIDCQDTPVNAIRSVAWCGIDNAGEGGMKWLQIGWEKSKDQTAKIYWEYTDKDGTWAKGNSITPTTAYTYQVSKELIDEQQKAVWKYGDTVYKLMPWSDFSSIDFKRAVYTAETIDTPDDHTPGGVDTKNKFAACQNRKAGGTFADANFNGEFDNAQHGHLETYAGGGSNLRTWDDRD